MCFFRKLPNISEIGVFKDEADSYRRPIVKYEMLRDTPDILEHGQTNCKGRGLREGTTMATSNVTEV